MTQRTPVVVGANHKGGAGKTAWILGLADAARRKGLKVLVIDADQQCNATTRLGVILEPGQPTLAKVIAADDATTGDIAADAELADVIRSAGPGWEGVDVVPGSTRLGERDREQGPRSLSRLARLLRRHEAEHGGDYDLVLIDTPPALGQMTLNALHAATAAYLVTTPDIDSIEGMSRILKAIRVFREDGQDLRLGGVVVNRYDPNVSEDRNRLEEVRHAYGDAVVEPVIRLRPAVNTARGRNAPISSLGFHAYDLPEVFDAHLAHALT